MIHLKHLNYAIKNKVILNDLDLSVSQGQYFSLAGVNGAGKSTLIKLMLDLLRTPEESMIEISGVPSWQVNSRQVLSYLPEKFHVNKSVTGQQYLDFIYAVNNISKQQNVIESLIEQLDFPYDALHSKVNTYSKGMMQKMGLISNFMLKKPLMILDEPLSGLDPKARFLLKKLLQKQKKRGLTLFYSTHMLADAEELCDQFAILDEGVLKFVGTPENCKKQYQKSTLEAAYMECIS